jgi:D-alanine-D-alanine ligase-like ATP-grasp enzyme
MRVLAKAEISLDKEEEGCALAKKIYLALGCSGLTKIDFFLDEKGYWYLNEVNPFPGFTKNNTYPSVWKAQGISYQELVNRLVIVAFSRFRKNRRSTSVACQLGKKLETLCVM